VGASTGGFTDCLLQRGAAKVFAVLGELVQLAERNLDFARHFAQAFGTVGDAASAQLLDRIYRDEIAHVASGLKWFRRWKNPSESDWEAFCRQLKFPLSPQRAKGFALNGYGEHSGGGYSLLAALVCEVVMTMFFLIIIMGATDSRAPAGFAPIAIGLALTLIHLISIPVTNTSVNPARSTGVAVIAGGWALDQLWLFWIAPIVGALLGAFAYRSIAGRPD